MLHMQVANTHGTHCSTETYDCPWGLQAY